jgi:hypothetical protein
VFHFFIIDDISIFFLLLTFTYWFGLTVPACLFPFLCGFISFVWSS